MENQHLIFRVIYTIDYIWHIFSAFNFLRCSPLLFVVHDIEVLDKISVDSKVHLKIYFDNECMPTKPKTAQPSLQLCNPNRDGTTRCWFLLHPMPRDQSNLFLFDQLNQFLPTLSSFVHDKLKGRKFGLCLLCKFQSKV